MFSISGELKAQHVHNNLRCLRVNSYSFLEFSFFVQNPGPSSQPKILR